MNISLEPANLSRREADLALRVSDPMMNSGGGDYIASRAGTLNFAAYCLDGTASQADIKNGVQAWTSLDYVSWHESRADLPMAKWLRSIFANRPPALACNSMQAQYAAIKAGLGVGLLPCFVGDRDASLQRLGPDKPIVSRELWLVYHRDLKASQRVICLRDFIQELIHTHLTV
jgi:DNA-binding transcriptional LysR family regulator